jgi:NAD(P)-dependent dehydrogenase (short-subunit alcohol dehydrogenase family)
MASVVLVVVVLIPILISYFFGGRVALYVSPPYSFNDIPDLTGKVALVTGSNTGIGYVTARELARKGAHVVATARFDNRGKEAVEKIKRELADSPSAGQVQYMKLDLSSFRQIQAFNREFRSDFKKLDILVLNAGVMMPNFKHTKEGFELQV